MSTMQLGHIQAIVKLSIAFLILACLLDEKVAQAGDDCVDWQHLYTEDLKKQEGISAMLDCGGSPSQDDRKACASVGEAISWLRAKQKDAADNFQICQKSYQDQSQQSHSQDISAGAVPQSEADQELATAISACENSGANAREQCALENQSGYKSFVDLSDAVGRQLTEASSMHITMACGQVGQAATSANAMLVTFKATCGAAYSSCSSVCDGAVAQARSLRDKYPDSYTKALAGQRACASSGSRLSGIDQQIAQVASNGTRLQQCKDLLSASGLTLEKCKANPSMIGCAAILPQDCNNPAVASTNLTCICIKTPTDSRCGGMSNASQEMNNNSSASTLGGASGSVAAGAKAANGLGSAGLSGYGTKGGYQIPRVPGGGGGSTGGAFPTGGGGGGGGGLRGGGGSSDPGSRQSAAQGRRPLNTNIYSGKYGGTYGAAFSGGGVGTTSAGNSFYQQGGQGQPGPHNNPNAKVDLRQFLPGGSADPKRALAGITGPDGITGPHSDLWKKVNIRYLAVRPSLKP